MEYTSCNIYNVQYMKYTQLTIHTTWNTCNIYICNIYNMQYTQLAIYKSAICATCNIYKMQYIEHAIHTIHTTCNIYTGQEKTEGVAPVKQTIQDSSCQNVHINMGRGLRVTYIHIYTYIYIYIYICVYICGFSPLANTAPVSVSLVHSFPAFRPF